MPLISHLKNEIAALELLRQLGVGYSTAWGVKHKLVHPLAEHEPRYPFPRQGSQDRWKSSLTINRGGGLEMKGKRYTEEQIIGILKAHEA